MTYWSSQVEKYEGPKTEDGKPGQEGELAEIKRKAEALNKDAEGFQKKAEAKEHESHIVHHSVNWIDFGHLGLEFALVLCSVAVLTKLRLFWYAGLGVAVAGALLALFGIYALFWKPF
jgi:hypothetical protein